MSTVPRVSTTVIEVGTSPHLHAERTVDQIMRNVVYAMLPVCLYGVYLFGLSAAAVLATSTATCLATEHLICRMSKRESSVGDYSAIITGMLLGLALPPGFPLWMTVVGGIIAVAPGKMLFGGLGFNVFNPALVGRAFLQAAFPAAIMSYTPPLIPSRFGEFIPSTLAFPLMKSPPLTQWLAHSSPDGLTGATPLTLQKFDHVGSDLWRLFLGERAGSIGETFAILIALCGLYLIIRGMMDWRITASMLLSAAVVSAVFHAVDPANYPSPAFAILSGGLMLGAVFMATDPVSSPVTPRGMWIYGAVMGLIAVLIRLLGGLAEGVMYAILLGNAISPLIDRLTQPRTYGELPRGAK